MKRFTQIESRAYSIPTADIDTDAILPARFLLLMNRKGLKKHLFHELRCDPSFPLNRPELEGAQIIVGGPRFGIGSSREQAVWALKDFGIRCVIASSFGEIFYDNCINNGILPITLSEQECRVVHNASEQSEMLQIDLEKQLVSLSNTLQITFEIDAAKRYQLLIGQDTLDRILSEDEAEIAAFEIQQKIRAPWLWRSPEQMARVTKAQ